MSPQSRLLLFEHVLPDKLDGPYAAVQQDLCMLVLTGGRERNEAEFRHLLDSNNFEPGRIIPTEYSRSLIETLPV